MTDTPETDKAERMAYSQEYMVPTDVARRLERERDEARGLARNLYSAGHELRRFAEAYADDYDEVDGKQGALEAISDFYDAIKDIAKILGEEAAK